MLFAEVRRYLLSLGHETLAIKLGLQNISLLLQRLSNPHQNFFAVQIAGTNGKGSTAAMLDAICCAAGIRVGLFTSPHLVSITERIRINGQQIAPEDFADCASEVRDAAEALVNESLIEAVPSFFEQMTAIALLAFQKFAVNVAILETGLGGRLDATTAVGAELVGITAVAMDHEEYLGDTLADIAAEKAAVIHPGVTAIVAPQAPEALRVIISRAESCGVRASIDDCKAKIESMSATGQACVAFKTPQQNYEQVRLGLRGRHQVTNAAVAIRLAESLNDRAYQISRDAVKSGLERATHPGRLDLYEGQPGLLLDGAHNPSGAQTLRDYLDEFVNGPITLVFGAMHDKRLDQIADIVFPAARHLILTRPDNPRAASLDVLQGLAKQFVEKILITESLTEAVALAHEVTPPEGLICITGSLYLLGEFFSLSPGIAVR